MNAEQLNAIKERAAITTPGPWKYSEQYGYLAPVIPQRHVTVICNEISRNDDAEFIAKSREDVPALIAEVERLQELLKQSLETQVKYAIALSKISCDSQYLNVASSSKGGEQLIEIAKEALK